MIIADPISNFLINSQEYFGYNVPVTLFNFLILLLLNIKIIYIYITFFYFYTMHSSTMLEWFTFIIYNSSFFHWQAIKLIPRRWMSRVIAQHLRCFV